MDLKKKGVYEDTNGDGKVNAGDVIKYTFTVTNTGNVTLTGVKVNDAKIGVTDLAVTPADLTPGQAGTAEATYTLKQADIDAGKFENTATATGNDPNGTPVTDTSDDPTTTGTPDDPTSTPLPADPKMDLKKKGEYEDKNGDGKVNEGDVINYTFTVENTGNVTLKAVKVNDAKIGVTDLAVTPADLAPGKKGTATATYTLKQADIDAGKFENTATATGNDPDGNPVTDTSDDPKTPGTPDDPTSTPLPATPELTLNKTTDALKYKVGDVITYTFVVENTGNVTINNVTITDPMPNLSAITPKDATFNGTLAPGEKAEFTATYTAVQADLDKGKIENSATANGTDVNNTPVSDVSDDDTPGTDENGDGKTGNDPTFVTNTQMPRIELDKSSTVPADAKVGDEITYTFVVKNIGNVTLTDVTVTDPMPGLTAITPASVASLAPHKSATFTAKYTLTQKDFNKGVVENSATATGTPPNKPDSTPGTPVTDTSDSDNPNDKDKPGNDDPTTTPLKQVKKIDLKKKGVYEDKNGDGKVNAGDVINYTLTVTNTGNVTVTDVKISDPKLGMTDVAVTPSTLEPKGVATVTKAYELTQADIDKGGVENTAKATGKDPKGGDVEDDSDSDNPNDKDKGDDGDGDGDPTNDPTTTPLPVTPKLDLKKEATAPAVVKAGEKITYTFTVENTGDVTLKGVKVNDAKIGVTDLAENTATATGNDPDGNPVTDTSDDPTTTGTPDDPTSTPLSSNPKIELKKEATAPAVVKAGEKITYTFTVENTGNVTVKGVKVNDAKIGVTDLAVTPADLAPGQKGTATAEYTLKQEDIDAGKFENTATATGNDPNGTPVTDTSDDPKTPGTPDDPTSTPLPAKPEMDLKKKGEYEDTNNDGKVNEGDVINYTFTVENTGNVTLKGVKVNDAKIGVTDLAVTPADLTPGKKGTATATYTLKQADIDAGKFENTATATGNDPNGTPVTDTSDDPKTPGTPDDPTSTPLPPTPELTLNKTTDALKHKLGDVITYNFVVENTGNVTINNVTITDPMPNLSAITPKDANFNGTLAPGEKAEFTATYTVVQADMDKGRIENSATANGTDVNNTPVSDVSDDDTPGTDEDGDGKTGNDPTYVSNEQIPRIELDKSSTVPADAKVGDEITYTFVVRNIGNVTLTDVKVDDPMKGLSAMTPAKVASLAPHKSATFTAKYKLTQKDFNKGVIKNSATATGTPPNKPDGTPSDPITDVSDSENPKDKGNGDDNDDDKDPSNDPTRTFLKQVKKIDLKKKGEYEDKNGDGKVNEGDVINYTFTVTNTGNVNIKDVTISDGIIGIVDLPVTPSNLHPNDVGTATTIYTLKQSDIDAGKVENTAIATATPRNNPDGTPGTPVTDVSDSDNPNDKDKGDDGDGDGDPTNDPTTTPLVPNPKMELKKKGEYEDANKDGKVNAGDVIKYTFTVENTGTITLKDVKVNDAKIGVTDLEVKPAKLAPRDKGTAEAKYVLKQADIDAGKFENTATATGNDPSGNPVTDTSDDPTTPGTPDDPTVTTFTPEPKLDLKKKATTVPSKAKAGDKITYTFTVENTGNVTVKGVKINDAKIGVTNLAVTPSDLAPGDKGTATAEYTLQQADIDAGKFENTATATGNDPSGKPVTDTSDDPTTPGTPDDPTVTIFTVDSKLDLKKEATTVPTNAKVGDKITYTFTVENTGSVMVTGVTINDAKMQVNLKIRQR